MGGRLSLTLHTAVRGPRGAIRDPASAPRCPLPGLGVLAPGPAQDRGAGAAPPCRRDPAVRPCLKVTLRYPQLFLSAKLE